MTECGTQCHGLIDKVLFDFNDSMILILRRNGCHWFTKSIMALAEPITGSKFSNIFLCLHIWLDIKVNQGHESEHLHPSFSMASEA